MVYCFYQTASSKDHPDESGCVHTQKWQGQVQCYIACVWNTHPCSIVVAQEGQMAYYSKSGIAGSMLLYTAHSYLPYIPLVK